MTTPTSGRRGAQWQRHFFYTKASIKTTWKLRLALLLLGILLVSVTRGFWMLRIGQSLVCPEEMGQSDGIMVENFDPDYRLFERAAALHKAGFAARILVPTSASRDPARPSTVSKGIVDVMSHVARMHEPEIIPIQAIEPISLHAAYQIRDFLTKEHLKSVIVVTPGFRSQRSSLVYHAVLDPAGIQVYCVPVFGQTTPENWTATWHGIQDVTEQFLKLQFYRFHVLWH